MLCATALVLLLDGSASISSDDWQAQVEHTAAAIEAPEVVQAIERQGAIAVATFAFSDAPTLMVGWRVLQGSEDARRVAALVRQGQRGMAGGTRIGAAIAEAHRALMRAPCVADALVVDLSTDGDAPELDTAEARDAAQADGVRINVIAVGDGRRFDSLREHAGTGDGFLIHANDWDRYAALVRRKIILGTAAR